LIEYSVTASTQNGQNWLIPLTVSGATGTSSIPRSTILVGVNPSGLSAGTYLGQILVQSTTTQDAVSVAVALPVGPSSALSVTPSGPQSFSSQSNTAVTAGMTQTLTVTSSTPNANITATLNPQVPWLTVTTSTPTATPGGGTSETITLSPVPTQNV